MEHTWATVALTGTFVVDEAASVSPGNAKSDNQTKQFEIFFECTWLWGCFICIDYC